MYLLAVNFMICTGREGAVTQRSVKATDLENAKPDNAPFGFLWCGPRSRCEQAECSLPCMSPELS